jgi:hypothetical protein
MNYVLQKITIRNFKSDENIKRKLQIGALFIHIRFIVTGTVLDRVAVVTAKGNSFYM